MIMPIVDIEKLVGQRCNRENRDLRLGAYTSQSIIRHKIPIKADKRIMTSKIALLDIVGLVVWDQYPKNILILDTTSAI